MTNKVIRLSKALWLESVKRLPAILLIFVFLLLWQSYSNGQKANVTLDRLDKQGIQLKRQGDTISQQNKDIKILTQALNNKTDNINSHVDCIVALFLPDKLPPTDADIGGCRSMVVPQASSASGSNVQQTQTPSGNPQPAPQVTANSSNTATPPPTDSSGKGNGQDNRGIKQRILDLLNPNK